MLDNGTSAFIYQINLPYAANMLWDVLLRGDGIAIMSNWKETVQKQSDRNWRDYQYVK